MRACCGLAVIAAIVCGCSGGNSIVGTWEGQNQGTKYTQTFKPDGTFEGQIRIERFGPLAFNVSGTYDLGSNQLTVLPNKLTVTGTTPDQAKQWEEKLGPGIMQRTSDPVTFVSNDEFRLETKPSAVTMKRRP
jgi:hypothetical protein